MGQDGHDRGAKVIASGFADLGFDAFQEKHNILSSYIPLFNYNEKKLQGIVDNYSNYIISFFSPPFPI